ncbi:MAG: signal peptidase I [Anaerolineales bacterium]
MVEEQLASEQITDVPFDEDLTEDEPSLRRSFGVHSWLQDTLETLLLAIILFLVINTLTGRYQVHGQSMEPSLHDGQYLLASKVTYWLHPPERGDIVVLDPPGEQSDVPYIKRLIGLPEDIIAVRDRRVWVNGVPLIEPYIDAPPTYIDEWQLGENEYLVLGDNRNHSSDSHAWGLLSRDRILAKAVFSYWPPEHWGVIPHHPYTELETSQSQ